MGYKIAARRTAVVGWDMAMWFAAAAFLLLVRFDLDLSLERWLSVIYYVVAGAVLQAALGFRVHLYLGRSRTGSYGDVVTLSLVVGFVAVVVAIGAYLIHPEFSTSIAILVPVLALFGMVSARVAIRAARTTKIRNGPPTGTPAIVYGAGDAGTQVARLVDTASEPPYRLVGFLDDDPGKRYLRVRSYRVLGRGSDLENVADETGAEVVILALSNAGRELIDNLAQRCENAGIKLVVVPPVRDMINGRVELDKLRELDVTDLLGRRPIETDISEIAGYVSGKVVLVTGAGGSIGSELALQVKRLGPSKLVLLDRDESALHGVQLDLYGRGLLDTDDMVLCDIRDADALRKVFRKHRPQVVFHAAALKHLPMLEQYPDEGWKTNVLGTLNVLDAARDVHVERFVNISTDKAADATAVLGQTKRLAERLTAHYAKSTGVPYLSVRFGNVLGSRGSVLHTFRRQIERGGPLTVTHPDVTRYFMTIPEACELVLQAGAIGRPGDVLVLDMGEPVRIVDVAKRLIQESGKRIELVYTGLRAGEKMNEVLFSEGEDGSRSAHPLISQVPVPAIEPAEVLGVDSWDDLDVAEPSRHTR